MVAADQLAESAIIAGAQACKEIGGVEFDVGHWDSASCSNVIRFVTPRGYDGHPQADANAANAPESEVLKCRDVTELTTDFMEGVLPPMRWMAMRWHLMICPACSAFVGQMRRTSALLGRVHLPVSPETEAAIAARLAAARDQEP